MTPVHDRLALPNAVKPSPDSDSAAPTALAYGMGRSYGDVCLNPGGRLIATAGLNKFIAFDPTRGLLTAEAGNRHMPLKAGLA